jgi:hypothetical protein
VVEHLSSKRDTLSTNPSTGRKQILYSFPLI